MDGEWEAPQIPNPKCDKSVSGCGEWERPLISNPKYKGKWKPPMIDNPNYQVMTSGYLSCPDPSLESRTGLFSRLNHYPVTSDFFKLCMVEVAGHQSDWIC